MDRAHRAAPELAGDEIASEPPLIRQAPYLPSRSFAEFRPFFNPEWRFDKVSSASTQKRRNRMTAKTRLQRLAIQAATRAKAAATLATREANRLLKEARRRATDERTQRRIKQALQKTGRVLKAASMAAVAAGRAEMNRSTRRRRR
jgi:hypothetical protein